MFLTSSQICYNKRKRGLIKKAMEVVLLTGTRVLMTIYDPVEGRFTTYFSHDKLKDFKHEGPVIDERFCTQDVSLI